MGCGKQKIHMQSSKHTAAHHHNHFYICKTGLKQRDTLSITLEQLFYKCEPNSLQTWEQKKPASLINSTN